MARKKKDEDYEGIGGLERRNRNAHRPQLKGGKQSKRDKRFGVDDPEFWQWWHRKKKKEYGRDGEQKEILKEYNEWLEVKQKTTE